MYLFFCVNSPVLSGRDIGVGINVEPCPVNQFLTDLPICALIVKAQMTCVWRQTGKDGYTYSQRDISW
jgi:hypothetical protein